MKFRNMLIKLRRSEANDKHKANSEVWTSGAKN